ncbi:MAG: peroxiredoxin [Deltaproteobacteria bacterium]|nr:peroxiredoxin [Deltaproteobacteria bacterium]
MKEGEEAPGFELEGSDGKKHTLKDFKGKPLVVYFYPRDNTPGCTRESCDFTAGLTAFRRAGAEVVGISPDSVKSHLGFIEKQGLRHLLLADPERQVSTEWGVYREKVLYGKKSLGIVRSTFIVDGKGVVRKVFDKVKVDGHVDKVLAALKELD